MGEGEDLRWLWGLVCLETQDGALGGSCGGVLTAHSSLLPCPQDEGVPHLKSQS